MFNFLKEKIKKIYTSVAQGVSALFSQGTFDEAFLKQLSDLLITADTGVKTSATIIDRLKEAMRGKSSADLAQAKIALEGILNDLLRSAHHAEAFPKVLMMVGINGSGKTTFVAKYAALLKAQGKRVMVVAGDTFRAAATQQLATWAERVGVTVFIGKENQDPAAVIFDACEQFKQGSYDHIIIDTAGRLQTKVNLMKELEKIKKILQRQLGDMPICTWLTLDAMLGQNSLAQADIFYEATKVNGLVLTKLDGTGKGGVVFAVTAKLQLPIVYITFGEGLEDMKLFDAGEYVHNLLHS
jgi:fused signal recognition particle receptor